jgi:hypothetical protein
MDLLQEENQSDKSWHARSVFWRDSVRVRNSHCARTPRHRQGGGRHAGSWHDGGRPTFWAAGQSAGLPQVSNPRHMCCRQRSQQCPFQTPACVRACPRYGSVWRSGTAWGTWKQVRQGWATCGAGAGTSGVRGGGGRGENLGTEGTSALGWRWTQKATPELEIQGLLVKQRKVKCQRRGGHTRGQAAVARSRGSACGASSAAAAARHNAGRPRSPPSTRSAASRGAGQRAGPATPAQPRRRP